LLVSDEANDAAKVAVERRQVTLADSLPMDLVSGGGFIARFKRDQRALSAKEMRQ
jgi:hypothetical protein